MWKIKMGDAHHAPKAKVAATIAVANANSNANSTNPLMKKPKDRVPVKVSLTEINQYLMCQLCSGYLIDATAIIECQHTFCKSCILKYLETNSYCPICDVQLNKAKPHLSLRADAILQKLVYKTVPGLFVSEIRRRKDFARKFPSDSPAGTLVELDEAEDLCVLSPDDAVSLSLEYFKSDEDSNEQKQGGPQSQQQQTKQQALQSQKKSTCSDKANDRRYLQCPAAVSVGLLKKFIRMKYGLLDDYRVDLLYNGDRDSNLENDLTLLDLAFIFKWNKDEPMCFHYRIFDRPVKSVSPRPGTKRPAPSMMDEPPPDDDAASGPPNRSSMASASPSKLPRISESGTNSNNTSNSTTNSSNTTNSSSSASSHSSSSPSASSLASAEGGTTPSSTSTADSPKKTSKGHSSHKSNHKKGKGHLAEEIPSSTMSRRSMSANATGGNVPVTRGRTNSVAKKEEESKSKSSVNASSSVSKESKMHKQPSVTTKLNNGSVKLSISTACLNVPPSSRSASPPRERLKISLGNIAKEKSSHNHHSHEKRHHHHHHRRHKLKKEKNREKKDKKNKDRDKEKSKHGNKIKLSLNLNSLTANSSSCSSSSSNSHLTNNSSSNSSSPSSSNNHNQSQNQSQQFSSSGKDGGKEKESSGKGKQQTNGNSSSSNSNAGNRLTSSSSHPQIGVNVNSRESMSNVNQSQNQGGVKIKATTAIISKNPGLDIQPANNSSSPSSSSATSSSSARTSGNNHHPLLPDSVQVPKSVTLIPVNPNAPNSSKTSNNSSRGGEKSSRLNSHTFTHPITNKSLHQITVTEVPPPQQKPNCPATNTPSNTAGNSNTINATSTTGANQTSGGSSSLEKAIVNATSGTNANKPQFSGPGSMEITKIYSSPAGSKVFDSATAKKLKERKGLDISISGTSLSVVKPTVNSREENYRQNISTGGMGQQSNSVANTNKAKSAAAALLSGKMPPGITIGPANAMASNNSRQNDPSKGGLTFTIPHHMGTTSIPGNLPALRNIGTKLSEKNGKKDSNSGNGKAVRTPPPPPPPTATTTTVPPPQIQQQQPSRKLENLSTMFDVRGSPSPPKEKNSSAKEQLSSATGGNNSKGFKRSFDAGSLNRKNHLSLATASSAQNQRESPGPERKRDRSNSNSGSRSSSSSTAADHDSPLDLSGKSSRSEHTSSSKSDISFPKGANRPPTPVPKSVSPLQTSTSGKSSSSAKESTSYHQTNKNNSSAKPLNPNSNAAQQNQTILSIAQSLHQKQQQQQQTQFLQHQLGLGLQNNQKSNSSSSARTSPHIANSLGNQSNSNMSSNNGGGNSNISGNPLDSLSSQMIPLSTPSPPNTAGFNSLRMLADATLLHKMHPMNSLMAVAGMCSQGVPPLSLSNAAASVGNQLSPGMYGQTGSGAMSAGKSSMGPPHGLLDPSHHNIFAALQNQSMNNGRVGGMIGNPFGSSLSPPLYYAGNSVRPQTQLPPPTGPSLRIPNVTPKLSSGGKSPSSLNSPISSMTPSHLYPSLSPNSNSNSKAKSSSPSPPSGATSGSSSLMSSVLNSNPPSRSTNNNSMSNTFNSHSSGNQRSQKINGIHSSVPIIPPGVHNPLLPSRMSTSSNSPGHNYLSAALASTASKANSALAGNSNSGKSVSSPNSSSPTAQSSASKSGIPASMKISNFLPPPNKSVSSTPYNANAQATITSSSSISSSLARFLNSLPPLLPPSQQQVSQQHSLSLLPPFSVPSTKVETSPSTNKPLTSESNAKSVGKSHSSGKIGFGASSDRKETKSKDETIGSSSTTSSLSTSADKGKITSGASSNATGFGAPLNLNMSLGLPGLGSPPSSSRITQPQSQAVRHIPNPCLLFNRQNSGGNNNNVNINVNPPSSITPTMTLNSFISPINNDSQHDSTNTNTTVDGKKSPIRMPLPLPPTILPTPTMPLQAQVASHSMLSLFPGVSVPLKVEVPAETTERKEELPLASSSPSSYPVAPPVKKAKVEIIEKEISPANMPNPNTVPTPLGQPIIPQVMTTSSPEKIVKEETPVALNPSQNENKQEALKTICEKITENCLKTMENRSREESIKINNKVEEDNAKPKVEKQLQPLPDDKKEDLEQSKDNEEIHLVNEDNSTAEVDNEDVDIVDVVSVEEETEKIVVVIGENEGADKKTTDVAVNILDSSVKAENAGDVSLVVEDVKERDENLPNKIVSKIETEREVEGWKDEEEKIPVILTGTDSKEIVTGDKLEMPEPKIELDVDMAEEVKTDIRNEMERKCEEQESASESAMEIDVVGDDGEIELDVGVDEPMEVPLQGILQSLKSDENSQSVLPNDNEMHSEETPTVPPLFIHSSPQVVNNCTDTLITCASNEENIPENNLTNIPIGIEESPVEGSPAKKMKFSEEIDEIIKPQVENEIVSCENKSVVVEKEKEEVENEEEEMEVDVCDEGSERKINSEDNSVVIGKEEFPVEVSAVEKVSPVVTDLPCDPMAEEMESKVNNCEVGEVSESVVPESVVCESGELKTVENEEIECKIEVEGLNAEKVDIPVESVENEAPSVETAGAGEEECKAKRLEWDSSLENEIREDKLKSPVEKNEKASLVVGIESSTEVIASTPAVLTSFGEKMLRRPSLVAIDYSSDNEDELEEIDCEEKPEEDLTVNKSQNIIQMSESSLMTVETPTVIPSTSDISIVPDDLPTVPTHSLPTEIGEEAIKENEETAETEGVETTAAEEVPIQQQPENPIVLSQENCTSAAIERKTDTDTPVSITIPGEDAEQGKSNDDETEASRNLSMSSPNSEADGSSSSLSSPSSLVGIVGVGVQRVNLKKMENLEKVAAGLLATANMNMGSININNNNNSLAPASCDITITTANQC